MAISEPTVMTLTAWKPRLEAKAVHRKIFVLASSCLLESSGTLMQDSLPWFDDRHTA